ncbi:MAG: hypothetical protein US96_C0037G0006 [Candidatus Woesebacteria bacterium GW2011_GWB1_38_5b]|uniref:DUF3800 domain-containing protein n=1 Tax=Candidatus Woesebacteria bacterium GW2011_GWB1_38_5b TaxID=1618569 RepID=A0A0G0NAW2_9BACT|nr:MAG: hypothetical protein US96_C0037G0006 [Candidatus Woesebacteria bacterium GW2011_GWB1_38_5b]
MIIFIDESGISRDAGYSTTAVVYVEINDLDKIEKQIVQILSEMNLQTFHWADHGWKIRDKFFRNVMKLEFKFKIAIFKNPILPEKMIETVFQHLITEKYIKNIYVDGKKPKWYERKLKKVLRDKGASVKKLKTVRDEISQPGI